MNVQGWKSLRWISKNIPSQSFLNRLKPKSDHTAESFIKIMKIKEMFAKLKSFDC